MLTVKRSPSSSRAKKSTLRRQGSLRLPKELQLNMQAFEKIQLQVRRGAALWPKGHYVGISQGKVVAVSSDFETVALELNKVEPDRSRGMIFRIGDDYSRVMKTLTEK